MGALFTICSDLLDTDDFVFDCLTGTTYLCLFLRMTMFVNFCCVYPPDPLVLIFFSRIIFISCLVTALTPSQLWSHTLIALPTRINTLVLPFNYFSFPFIYVCGVILLPLFTFHRSLIFFLITCSTLKTTTSLPDDSYSNSRRTRFLGLSTRRSIQFTFFLHKLRVNQSPVSNP